MNLIKKIIILLFGFFYIIHTRPFPVFSEEKPNIIIIVMDAVRPDHLGCYGYNKNTSPHIDAIAKKGVMFMNCYSAAPWTNSAIASLFTGLYPQKILPPNPHPVAMKQKLPEEITTLAEVFAGNGYRTAAILDHLGLGSELNYNQGFAEYICDPPRTYYMQGYDARIWQARIDSLLEKYKHDAFFAWFHIVHTHQPYIVSSKDGKATVLKAGPFVDKVLDRMTDKFKEKVEKKIIWAYDNEIGQVDALIGWIFQELKRKNLLDNTYVIILADHGESFWEHGVSEHGNSLYNEVLKIPFIISLPPGVKYPNIKIDGVTNMVDIFPTILAIANIKSNLAVDGENLIPYIEKGKRLPDRTVFSENAHDPGWIYAISGENRRYKLIYWPRNKQTKLTMIYRIVCGIDCFLYDLKKDPGETVDLFYKKYFTSVIMGWKIMWHKIRNDAYREKLYLETAEIDNNDSEQLKSLGYMQ